jgi:hypothetical protein
MGPEGLIPQTPAALQQAIIAEATALSPGLTANLPGSLISDMSGTAAGAGIICDQACVASINNVTPIGANEFTLGNLGQIYGVQPGIGVNTSVFVVFTGTVGFVIPIGFIVSDGSHQYQVQDGGIIGSGGSSQPLFCLATTPGSWPVPSGTVTTLITSVPGTITLAVTNPANGTPATSAQTPEDYRAQVIQAGQAVAQGMTSFLRTQIQNVPGVESRLVSIRPYSTGWEVIVGGSGDPDLIGYAIFKGMLNFNTLLASTQGIGTILGITNANPGVAHVASHGYTSGEQITIAGVVGMTGVNGGPYAVTVIDSNHFSFGVDTTSSGSWTSGGTTKNLVLNQSISVQDYPDTYSIYYVIPPQQIVSIGLTWNTSASNYISDAAVQSLGIPAFVNYINSIPVGQPINIFQLQEAFQQAVVDVIPTNQLTRMVFAIEVNGVSVSVEAGTEIIAIDSESYVYCTSTDISIVRG